MHRRLTALLAATLSATLAACGSDARNDSPDTAGQNPPSSGETTSSAPEIDTTTGSDAETTGTATPEDPSSGSDPSDGLKLDVQMADLGDASSQDGCTAVDILFVIDNSGSMCGYQSNLAQTLPDFADAIFSALPADTSLHIGITTSSFSSGGSHQEQNCVSVQGAAEIADAYTLPSAEQTPGNGYQGRLLEYEGQRYFEANTGDPASRLPMMEWFANAAFSVNCNGGAFEFPTAAAAYALDPVNEATNAGFLRDEGAVLSLFVLSDEVDQSPEGVDVYRDKILQAKAGCGETCISTAGLLSEGCVDSDPLVWRFLNAFSTPPQWGSISDPAAYASVVSDSLAAVISQTCELVPAG